MAIGEASQPEPFMRFISLFIVVVLNLIDIEVISTNSVTPFVLKKVYGGYFF